MIFPLIAIVLAAGAVWFLVTQFGGGSSAAGATPAPGATPTSGSAIGDLFLNLFSSGSDQGPPAAPGAAPAPDTSSSSGDLGAAAPTASSPFPTTGASAPDVGPGPSSIERWRPLAEKYASIYSILNPEEILAIIWNESTGNPEASNPSDPSVGLMGVTLNIGRAYGGATTLESLYDADLNVKAGAGFLAYLKQTYADNFPISDPNVAWVAAYNEGETNLRKGRPDPSYIAGYLAHLNALGGTPQ